MAAADYRTPTYGNWRTPSSAGVYGLGAIGTGILLGGGIIVVITMRVAGILAAVIPLLVLLAVLGLLLRRDRQHNRTGLQRVAARIGGWLSTRSVAHIYRSGPLGIIPHGRHTLPGLAAGSELTEYRDSWGTPFAVVTYPTGDHVIAFTTEPDGSALIDPADHDQQVAAWAAFLALLGDEPGLVGAQVVIETAPDSGTRLRQEVTAATDPNAPEVSQAILREIVDTYPQGSATVRAWVTLTFSAWLRADSKRRTTTEVARDLGIRLPGLRQALAGTGAGAVHPATAQDWCEQIRCAYDPAVAGLIDAAHAAGDTPDLAWSEVGPAATHASPDGYGHDSGMSVTWEMTSAPRGEVFSSVLANLLDAHPDIDRKRVALLYRPHDSASAAKIVERDKKAAGTRVREAGKRVSDRDLVNLESATKAAQEEARGAGLVNFGMVVTATVLCQPTPTLPDRLAAAEAAVDNLSATARVGLRRVYRSQDSAFAFGLPLGLVPTRHLAVPSEVRENL